MSPAGAKPLFENWLSTGVEWCQIAPAASRRPRSGVLAVARRWCCRRRVRRCPKARPAACRRSRPG